MLAVITFPFIAKKPIEVPPIVSIELIQITDQTNIPYAPKAKKIIEKVKKKEEKLVSEQAPPKKLKKKNQMQFHYPIKIKKKLKKLKKRNKILKKKTIK
tara:strand:+ start:115 stop:411 length:297 start_codon:yes stop_codon:yes gene_type:complete